MKRHLKPLQLIEFSELGPNGSKLASHLEQQGRSARWVQLVVLPDSFSYDQALLLHRQSEDEWLAWVPDYGEVTLHVSEFYFSHEAGSKRQELKSCNPEAGSRASLRYSRRALSVDAVSS
jgi:hypothetical protein